MMEWTGTWSSYCNCRKLLLCARSRYWKGFYFRHSNFIILVITPINIIDLLLDSIYHIRSYKYWIRLLISIAYNNIIFSLCLQNNSTTIFSSKNSRYLFTIEVSQNYGNYRRRSFLITKLSILIIPPFHNIANVKQSEAMTFSALNLINCYFLFNSFMLNYIIGKFFYLYNITKMPNLIYSKLPPKIGPKCKNFITTWLFIFTYQNTELSTLINLYVPATIFFILHWSRFLVILIGLNEHIRG